MSKYSNSSEELINYFFRYLPFHLINCFDYENLTKILFDFAWLKAKLEWTGISDLLLDYDGSISAIESHYGNEVKVQNDFLDGLILVHKALLLSSQIIIRNKFHLADQLLSRLLWCNDKNILRLLNGAKEFSAFPWIQPLTTSLTTPLDGIDAILLGHPNAITCLSATKNNRIVISGSRDGSIRVWNPRSGICNYLIELNSKPISSIEIDEDNQLIFSLNDDGMIYVLDLTTGKLIRKLGEGIVFIKRFIVLPETKKLISLSTNNEIRVWSLENEKSQYTLFGANGRITSLSATPNGKYVVASSDNRKIFIWNTIEGDLLHKLEGHISIINMVKVTKDGEKIVSVSEDGTLIRWDLINGGLINRIVSNPGGLFSMEVSDDGTTVIASSRQGWIKIFCLETGKISGRIINPTDPIVTINITKDKNNVVTLSKDGSVDTWILTNFKKLIHKDKLILNQATYIKLLANDQGVLTGSQDGLIRIWDLKNKLRKVGIFNHKGSIISIGISSDYRIAITSSNDRYLLIWNLENRNVLRTIQVTNIIEAIKFIDGSNLVGLISKKGYFEIDITNVFAKGAVETKQNDPRFSSVIRNSQYLFNNPTDLLEIINKEPYRFPYFELSYNFTSLAITSDGQKLILGFRYGALKILERDNNKITRLDIHKSSINSIVVSPNNLVVASSSSDNLVKIWDLTTYQVLHALVGHSKSVSHIIFSPDGNQIITASDDYSITIWSLSDGRLINNLLGHSASINGLIFIDETHYFISYSSDHSLIIWDINSGKKITEYLAEAPITVCKLIPLKFIIIMGDEMGRVHFLDISKAIKD